MKKAFVEAWLSALRSGQYKQYRGAMNNDVIQGRFVKADAFCCLGVGCIVSLGAPKIVDNTVSAVETLELTEANLDTLIDLNDKQMKSFPEIADWIEANILPNATEE